jgi:lysozyme
VNSFTTSDVGLGLIKQFEGLRCEAYRDIAGIPTIGYGKTSNVSIGMKCTPQQAEDWLREDVKSAEALVLGAVKVPLTQSAFDALVSLVYNVGPGRAKSVHDDGRDGIIRLRNGQPSTLLRYLNMLEYPAARNQFVSWCMSNGRPSPGLQRRRMAEAELFEMDPYPQPESL